MKSASPRARPRAVLAVVLAAVVLGGAVTGCNDDADAARRGAAQAAAAKSAELANQAAAQRTAAEAQAAAEKSAAGTAAPAFVGAWKLDSVSTKDGPVPRGKLDDGGMNWDFHADGTLAMKVWTKGQEATSNATWTVEHGADGDVIAIDENGQQNRVRYERKGANLVLSATASSVVMTFAPAPAPAP